MTMTAPQKLLFHRSSFLRGIHHFQRSTAERCRRSMCGASCRTLQQQQQQEQEQQQQQQQQQQQPQQHFRSAGAFIPSTASGRFTQTRFVSTTNKNPDEETTTKPQMILQKRGDFPYGSREYRLVVARPPKNAKQSQQQLDTTINPGDTTTSDDDDDDTTVSAMQHLPVASLRAHRNIIFGAQLLGTMAKNKKRTLSNVCLPLLDAALEDCSVEGEQPQAMATLHGMCDWVTQCLQTQEANNEHHQPPQQQQQQSPSPMSKVLHQLQTESQDDDLVAYHAVRAIATGIPREGHSVVGQGTFRDGEVGWEALAQEFIELGLANEVELYRARGGTVVAIEHLADTKPAYLKSAGGAMARLFFM